METGLRTMVESRLPKQPVVLVGVRLPWADVWRLAWQVTVFSAIVGLVFAVLIRVFK